MNLIVMKNVRKQYKTGVVAIHDLSLDIEKGDFVFIIGSTGCGKSTLIKMIYREEKPTSGKIIVGGKDVAKFRNSSVYKIRRSIGVVFQDFKLLSRLTVYENVAFALEILGLSKDEIHDKVLKVLELVGLKHKAKNYPNQLSGGEQQRVALARALVNNPSMLIADEPTGNLDSKNERNIFELLKKLSLEGKCVIVVSHNEEIKKYADVVLKIRDGKLYE